MLIPDAKPVAEMADGSNLLPEATYNYRVHKAEYVSVPKTATAKGPYIKAQLIVTGPGSDNKFLGRYVFMNYSITGDGSFRLRELLTVTGHPDDFKLEDDQQLVGLEFAGATIVKDGTGGYGPKNEIRKHVPMLVTA